MRVIFGGKEKAADRDGSSDFSVDMAMCRHKVLNFLPLAQNYRLAE